MAPHCASFRRGPQPGYALHRPTSDHLVPVSLEHLLVVRLSSDISPLRAASRRLARIRSALETTRAQAVHADGKMESSEAGENSWISLAAFTPAARASP